MFGRLTSIGASGCHSESRSHGEVVILSPVAIGTKNLGEGETLRFAQGDMVSAQGDMVSAQGDMGAVQGDMGVGLLRQAPFAGPSTGSGHAQYGAWDIASSLSRPSTVLRTSSGLG